MWLLPFLPSHCYHLTFTSTHAYPRTQTLSFISHELKRKERIRKIVRSSVEYINRSALTSRECVVQDSLRNDWMKYFCWWAREGFYKLYKSADIRYKKPVDANWLYRHSQTRWDVSILQVCGWQPGCCSCTYQPQISWQVCVTFCLVYFNEAVSWT